MFLKIIMVYGLICKKCQALQYPNSNSTMITSKIDGIFVVHIKLIKVKTKYLGHKLINRYA